MGGSGGDGRYRSVSPDTARRIEIARKREVARLNAAVNDYLAEILTQFNARDADLTNERLNALAELLDDVSEVDRVLLGGSVAKHTDVDGLSDVDALVVLDRADLKGKGPAALKAAFFAELHDQLPGSEVAEVKEGKMAVTVVYRDGMEVQLLPALRSGQRVLLGVPGTKGWSEVDPKKFQTSLTAANQRLGGALVPAIKLLKSINGDLPTQKQLSGYHLEALAVDAAKSYSGPSVPREVLIHFCKHASERVLKPITDITGQSRQADEYLGAANSAQRRIASQALSGIARRLETATSVDEWKAVFGE